MQKISCGIRIIIALLAISVFPLTLNVQLAKAIKVIADYVV